MWRKLKAFLNQILQKQAFNFLLQKMTKSQWHLQNMHFLHPYRSDFKFFLTRQAELLQRKACVGFYCSQCTSHCRWTAVRIRYKCLVPIYVYSEMKLRGHVISITELYCYVSRFPLAIYIFPGSVCLLCCSQIGRPQSLGIYKSLTDTWI